MKKTKSKKKTNKKAKNTFLKLLNQNRHIVFIVISLVTVSFLLITTSNAAFFKAKESEQKDLFSTGDLMLEILEEDPTINLENAIPIRDEYGNKQEPYQFTITNNGTYKMEYTVRLKELEETHGVGTVPNHFIKYSIDGKTPELLSNLNENIILEEAIGVGESHTYDLRLWIDYNATIDIQGYHFHASLSTTGKAIQN